MVRLVEKGDIPDWTRLDAKPVKPELSSPSKKRKALELEDEEAPKKAEEDESSSEKDTEKTSRAQTCIFKRDILFLFVFVLLQLTKHQNMFMYTSASSTGAKLNSRISSCSQQRSGKSMKKSTTALPQASGANYTQS